MTEILALTHSFVPYLSKTTLRQLRQIILAMLCIPGRITTLSLSRWTEKGGSHRTLQRWFHSSIDWATLLWTVIRVHLLDPHGEYFLAGDDVVVSKAGKDTHGLGRFYSSLAQRVIPSLSFFVISLIEVKTRRSYPLQVEQHLPSPRAKPSPHGLSVLDLKTHFRARRYLNETIKCLPVAPDEPLISRLWHRLTSLGGIRTQSFSSLSP